MNTNQINKYEFTGETKEVNCVTLKRIRRISDQLTGGWIEKEENLSQAGTCLACTGLRECTGFFTNACSRFSE